MPKSTHIIKNGPVAQLVSAPPCHGGGRGFKSRQGRHIDKPVPVMEPAFCFLSVKAPLEIHWGPLLCRGELEQGAVSPGWDLEV